jgi:two-component system OmpR family response regulator
MEPPPLRVVLLVEDDPDIRLVAKLALQEVGGLTVFEAASGPEALDLAASLSPDLILLDVMMPAMDGPATLKALRSDPGTSRIPVVFLTAKALPQEIVELRQLGALYVIAKPFDPMVLADKLQSVWRAYAGER